MGHAIPENTDDEIRIVGSRIVPVVDSGKAANSAGSDITQATVHSSIRTPIARTRDRTIPTPATISAGWTRATLTSSSPVRARRARSSISAAVATASIATGNLESPAATI